MVKMQVCVCVCLFVCFVVLVSVPYNSQLIDLHPHTYGEDAGVLVHLFVRSVLLVLRSPVHD
jgi:hypothetical protein